MSLIFFFQAEDGIRDYKVTGVQTCALPISVALGKRQQVVEMDEGQAGTMNQPVPLRERQVRDANRRIHQASGARAHGPPRGCYGMCCWIFCSNTGFG